MAWRKIGRNRASIDYLRRAAELARGPDVAAAEKERDDAVAAADTATAARYAEGEKAFQAPGGMRQARLAFEDVVRERPDFVAARLHLAMAHRGTGNLRAALDALEAAKRELEGRTPGSTGEDDASLARRIESLRAEVDAEWRRGAEEREDERKDEREDEGGGGGR
jgi:hypothetical protein